MKKVEEFIKEIENNDTLKNEMKAIKDKDALADFLKKYDCEETVEEFGKSLKTLSEGEIVDDDAEFVAGGIRFLPTLDR